MDNILNLSPIVPYLILILGFVLLVKGADYFVEGCSSVATRFRIPPIIIGLTIAALGTSAPEASVSITSSIKGANAMAVSNVIGSNIFNLLIVIGICAVIKPIIVSNDIIVRDYPISIIATILMLLFSVNFFTKGFTANTLGRIDGIILLTVFILYVLLLIKNTLKERALTKDSETTAPTMSIAKSIICIIGGAAAIAIGGSFVVDSAKAIALSFNISETLIGLTIVALGTSLPELVTSVVAASKGENDLAVGNVVGSNIFNILFVLGLASALCPIDLSAIANPMFTIYDTVILLGVTLIANAFILFKKNVSRIEGAIMVIIYIAYLAYIIVR